MKKLTWATDGGTIGPLIPEFPSPSAQFIRFFIGVLSSLACLGEESPAHYAYTFIRFLRR